MAQLRPVTVQINDELTTTVPGSTDGSLVCDRVGREELLLKPMEAVPAEGSMLMSAALRDKLPLAFVLRLAWVWKL